MKYFRILFKLVLAISVSVAAVLLVLKTDANPTENSRQQELSITSMSEDQFEKIAVKDFDERNFYSALSHTQSQKAKFPDCYISGGVIPHHLLVSHMISDLFSSLSRQDIETIILVGPNHYERGQEIISSDAAWITNSGIIYPDQELINSLKRGKILAINNEVVLGDHAIYGILPFMKYYVGSAKIVPILLKHDVEQQQIEKLSEQLKPYLQDRKTILISSVDFSHYLKKHEAIEKDKITLKAMQLFDYENIFKMNDDHLDSPASIVLQLMSMKNKGIDKLNVIENTNSGELLESNLEKTTSYFSIVFCDQ